MMTGKDDVMVANRICQEIGGLCGVRQENDLLRSAQIRFRLVPDQFPFFNERAGEVT